MAKAGALPEQGKGKRLSSGARLSPQARHPRARYEEPAKAGQLIISVASRSTATT